MGNQLAPESGSAKTVSGGKCDLDDIVKVTRPLTDESPIDQLVALSRSPYDFQANKLNLTIDEVEVIARRCVWPELVQTIRAFYNGTVDNALAVMTNDDAKKQFMSSDVIKNPRRLNQVLARAFGGAIAMGRYEDAKKIFEGIIELSKQLNELSTENVINTPVTPYCPNGDRFSSLYVWTPLQWACAVKSAASAKSPIADRNKEQANMVEYCLANGANVNGKTALQQVGEKPLINSDWENYHPLFIAIDAEFNHRVVAELAAVQDCILSDNQPISTLMNDTPLTHLCKRYCAKGGWRESAPEEQGGALNIATTLLARGAKVGHACEPNPLFKGAVNALDFAVFNESLEMIKVLATNLKDGEKNLKEEALKKAENYTLTNKEAIKAALA